jgi:hypothetical protein
VKIACTEPLNPLPPIFGFRFSELFPAPLKKTETDTGAGAGVWNIAKPEFLQIVV